MQCRSSARLDSHYRSCYVIRYLVAFILTLAYAVVSSVVFFFVLQHKGSAGTRHGPFSFTPTAAGQFDFVCPPHVCPWGASVRAVSVWLPARAPHGSASYVWRA